MQTTDTTFRQFAAGYVRPLDWKLRISFDKVFNEDTNFFILDTSVLDGMDILAPTDASAIQAWDRYAYADYDDRVISMEITREEAQPYSIVQAYADIALNNYDGYFTPGSGSPIDQYILPRRPFRASMGFGMQSLPQIVGLSDDMPELDKSSRTASFHVIDFMSYLLSKDVGESVILENVKTHEVLDHLFQLMGLTSDQYELDGSVNTIKFFYVERDTNFGTVAEKLMEAELGALGLDELGVIRFKNRYNLDTTPVYTFDKSNTIDYSIATQQLIINSVKITSAVREVKPLKSVGTGQNTEIGAGDTVEMFINFNDPVTSVIDPIYSNVEIDSSYFTSTLNSDGTDPYTDVSLTSLDLFSKSAKLIFHNDGASKAYITTVNIFGTPAEVTETINLSRIDQPSIDKFEERPYEIDNEYIQTENAAQTLAVILIRDYKNYANTVEIDVKGTPALQIGDTVTLDLDGFQGPYMINKVTNVLTDGRFQQRLRATKRLEVTFFTLDVSELSGADLLSP